MGPDDDSGTTITGTDGSNHYTYQWAPLSGARRLGSFDLHVDSLGNLRVIEHGKLVATINPKKGKK